MNFAHHFATITFRLAVIIFLLFVSFISIVSAQEEAGVGIKPASITDKLEPGETRSFSVSVSNLSGIDQTFYLSRRDIVDVAPGGVPVFANSKTERSGYELSEWITLEQDSVFIPAGEARAVPFVLQAPEDATPGGHFGAIVVSVEPPEMRSSGASIGYEVANIISMRIAGEVVESAQIRQFSTEKYIHSSIDVNFLVRIENEGNTLVKPIGPLEVTNMFGKQVANITFNENGAGVFPMTKNGPTVRDYEINWQDETPGFGRYEAVLSAVYGDAGAMKTMTSTVTFWVLPMKIVGPALVGLLVFFLVVYFGVKIYIKRTVAVMTGGSTRRLVSRRHKNTQFPVLLVFVTMLVITALLMIILLLLFS
ncbi:MAG: hypothetical protein R3B60_03670 [Candidatus Paceibacterota bacterium]